MRNEVSPIYHGGFFPFSSKFLQLFYLILSFGIEQGPFGLENDIYCNNYIVCIYNIVSLQENKSFAITIFRHYSMVIIFSPYFCP